MPAENENLAEALTEVSERLSVLVREEIELAKAEVTVKVKSYQRGAIAGAAGAVFGVFAIVFVLLTIAWSINDATGHLWIGFAVVMVVLLLLTAFAFFFAWRKFSVGGPKPDMAIEEARRIRATVTPGDDV
ncbi:MAG TPA: phage holin family protein [Solirubrobacteraceae bacterium]